MFKFKILKQSSKSQARVGEIQTPYGKIKTPAFIPVGTLGVIKGGLSQTEIGMAKVQCQIINSWHFLDLKRVKQIKKGGGLHKFFNIDYPIFTDSGGFQIFSLGKGRELGIGKVSSIFTGQNKKNAQKNFFDKNNSLIKKINKKGALFKSPRNGRSIMLTPQKALQVQKDLGADFIYCLDICTAPGDDYKTAKAYMELSHNWYKKFLNCDIEKHQQVFAIVQGGEFVDLRQTSARFVNDLNVFGIGIGGTFKTKEQMKKILQKTISCLDENKPRHLLGFGDYKIINDVIKIGIDLFDCAYYTRMARHGTALTSRGHVNVAKSKFKNCFKPIDNSCECLVCKNYSLAQINFLFKAKEMLGGKLLSIHNLFFINSWLEKIRQEILKGNF